MTRYLSFFSRDERTHRLFRSSWHIAAEECGATVQAILRGFGKKNAAIALFRFSNATGRCRVVFGTSEICLYAPLSSREDIWVFTGLGRLMLKEGWVARSVRTYLRLLHRGQILVVLNEPDRQVIHDALGAMPVVINGEGYAFSTTARVRAAPAAPRQLTFAFVGRLLKSKGVDLLISSFSRNSLSNWTLKVVGDSDFSNKDAVPETELKRLALSSRGRIVYTGFRQDVHSILETVDVLVSLSQREGLPFSVLEGVEAGVHLVLSPVPGHLSFSGLDGVTFVNATELDAWFEQIARDPSQILVFDRAKRLAECRRKFGQEAIVKEIGQVFSGPGRSTLDPATQPPNKLS